ncbi:MAG: twin-arginine translocase TatA/TatE family subunit [Chloroflexi bacterium]|nr:twin-arginine translocase TatA/TatE family subunit [Chloroflexota bacterium]
MPFRFEPTDIIIIAFVAFLIFGGIGRLPETTRAMGKAIREFRAALAGKDDETPKKETPPAPTESSKPS